MLSPAQPKAKPQLQVLKRGTEIAQSNVANPFPPIIVSYARWHDSWLNPPRSSPSPRGKPDGTDPTAKPKSFSPFPRPPIGNGKPTPIIKGVAGSSRHASATLVRLVYRTRLEHRLIHSSILPPKMNQLPGMRVRPSSTPRKAAKPSYLS